MRAVVIPRFGGPEVLDYRELPTPEPATGQVSIDVARVGVNYAEVLFRRGLVDVPLPYVPGIEVAGRVRAVGAGVEGLHAGQPVAALTMVDGGGYAEVAVTDARLVAPIPEAAVSGDDALATYAATPSNTTTALLVLETVAPIGAGSRVLVHGAAGGVGSQLGQVAKLLGAERVVGTVGRPSKLEAARALGYDEVVLREELEPPGDGRSQHRYDVVVDPVGGPVREVSLALLDVGGRLVAMGNASDADDVRVSSNTLWFSGTGVVGHNTAALAAARPDVVGAALRRAVGLVAERTVRVDVTEVRPLRDAAAAHRAVESGSTTGNLVLST